MVQVTWYDGTGRQLGQVTYSNLTIAWRMVAWRQMIDRSVRADVRILGKRG
jgi:hypothetical protein